MKSGHRQARDVFQRGCHGFLSREVGHRATPQNGMKTWNLEGEWRRKRDREAD